MSESGIEERDEGYRSVLAELSVFDGASVFVGVHQDALHETEEGTVSLAEIATVHEYGSRDGRVPQRSFMRATFDEKRLEIDGFVEEMVDQVAAGNLSPVAGTRLVGEYMVKLIRAKIASGPPPPLSEYTIRRRRGGSGKAKRKLLRQLERHARSLGAADPKAAAIAAFPGSFKPLNDTGQLLQGITSTVHVPKGGG